MGAYTAASASLASESTRLQELIAQFRIDGSGVGAKRSSTPVTARRPAPVSAPGRAAEAAADHRPVASPARRMINQVSKAMGLNTAEKADNWEEF